MPLRSLFSRNKKHPNNNADPARQPSNDPSSSNTHSIYSNIAASSSKLRLAFLSKPSSTSSFTHDDSSLVTAPPRPSQISRGSSASDVSIPDRRNPRSRPGPPPSKSALFAAYVDHNAALSTHSLPQRPTLPNFSSFSESLSVSEPIPQPRPPPTQPTKPLKASNRGFFPWTRARTKSKESDKDAQKQPDDRSVGPADYRTSHSPYTLSLPESNTGSSFNLKSFRHIRAPSPPLLPPIAPIATEHLRNGSNSSEANQRISVAAFREAYARRSGTGSPVPSTPDHEPPSPRVPMAASNNDNFATPSKSTPNLRARGAGPRQGARRSTAPVEPSRRSGTTTSEYRASGSVFVDSSESESEEEEEEEEDTSVVSVRRDSTGKGKGKGKEREHEREGERVVIKTRTKASSEVGHSYNSYARATPVIVPMPMRPSASAGRVMSAYDLEPEKPLTQVVPRSQSSLGVYGAGSNAMRARASVSASALIPSGGINASSRTSTGYSSSQSSSHSSYSSDDDDAPLASLVNARSPGSALSHGSGTSNPRKPLIDIRSLKMPTLPPSKGLQAGGPREDGRPVRFLSPVNSLVSARARKDRNTGGDKNKDREKDRGGVRTSRDKDQDTGVRLSGGNLNERLAKVVQQGAGAAVKSGVAVGKPFFRAGTGAGADLSTPVVAVTARSHRRASSDEYSGGARRDSAASWTLVEDKEVGRDDGREQNRVREKDPGKDEDEEKEKENNNGTVDRIVPTPIRQRVPPSSFSVTSRPQNPGMATSPTVTSPTTSTASGMSPPNSPVTTQTRQRSTTMVTPSSGSGAGSGIGPSGSGPVHLQPRQRSSSLIPYSVAPTSTPMPMPTTKPFAGRRWESPASSTGDSSSGRAPLTPGDGSDLGVAPKKGKGEDRDRDNRKKGTHWGTGVSGLGVGRGKVRGAQGHAKRSMVNFGDDMERERERERRDGDDSHGDGEMRRRERRRSEAKAAIELGNVINGPGPIVSDDEDEDDGLMSQGMRMSMMNPMMGMGMGGQMPMAMPMTFGAPGGPPGWGTNTWQQQQQATVSAMSMMPMQVQAPQMPIISPAQFMIPPPTDPNLFAAHQQAMMFAKQAYQMAVAQQALAAAGEEWERGSNGGMGMGMPWGSQMYAGGTRSVYGGISGAQSEYGGGGGGGRVGDGGGWSSSKSVYGEAFGPSGERDRDRNRARIQKSGGIQQGRESGHLGSGPTGVPPLPQGGGVSGNANASGRGGAGVGAGEGVRSVRARTTSVPGKMKKPIPPSSWRAGPVSVAAATDGG